MVLAKLSLFVVADFYDQEDNTPLVAIKGKPKMLTSAIQLERGGADMRYRAVWEHWSARVRMKWDADQFSGTDIVNLLSRVGEQVGIGEGRPDSKKSAGCDWGMFTVILTGKKKAA
jgi:hypothetical protein